jgi:glycosyltransferase involved in cell wall biosynthesis
MNNINFVSVILPTYNSEKTILKCLISLLNQSYKNFEIIIVDNCSTDNTIEIIKYFIQKQNKIKINLLFNKYKNLSLSLNMGMKVASGEYLLRMDSDDICLKDRIKTSLKFLINNPKIQLVGSSIYLSTYKFKFKKIMPEEHDLIYSLMPFDNPFCHPTIMFHKNILRYVGNYNQSNNFSEDYELWSRILIKYKAQNLNKFLLNYNMSSNQISNKINKFKIEELYSIQKKFFETNNFILNSNLSFLHKQLIYVSSFTDNYKSNYTLFLRKFVFIKKIFKMNIEKKTFEYVSFNKVLLIILFNISLYYSKYGLKILFNFNKLHKIYFSDIKINKFVFILYFLCLLRINNKMLKKFLKLQFSNYIYEN